MSKNLKIQENKEHLILQGEFLWFYTSFIPKSYFYNFKIATSGPPPKAFHASFIFFPLNAEYEIIRKEVTN